MTRSSDFLCRMGGEEFLLIMTDAPPEVAHARIDQIRERICAKTHTTIAGNKTFAYSISIGMSHFPLDGKNLETLIKEADAALYHAKSHGRNRLIRWQELGSER